MRDPAGKAVIVTVTPNPSLDRTLHVDELRLGELNRAHYVAVEASGKGVNVSRVLARRQVATVAVFPVGGSEGRELVDLLDEAGLPHQGVAVRGAARVNITVIEPGGRTTKINEPGGPLSAEEQDALVQEVSRLLGATQASSNSSSVETPGFSPGEETRHGAAGLGSNTRTLLN